MTCSRTPSTSRLSPTSNGARAVGGRNATLLESPSLMRAALVPTLALPLLLTYCGAKGDLIIGSLEPIVSGSSSVAPTAGTGATGAVAGSEQGGVGGSGGSATEG